MRSISEGFLVALALAAGAMLPLQALINARLGTQLGAPLWAAALQNGLGAAVMGVALLAFRAPPPAAAAITGAPVWSWAGGILGATYVLIALLATPRLGATRAMVAIITGQLVASLLLDQFGVLQAPRAIDLRTIGGLALLAGGAWLILARD